MTFNSNIDKATISVTVSGAKKVDLTVLDHSKSQNINVQQYPKVSFGELADGAVIDGGVIF